MSTVTNVLTTSNQATTNFDVSKLMLGDNSFTKANYTDSGAGSTLAEGSLMGRITATSKIVLCDPEAVDGSQFPVGVVIESRTVTAAATVEITMVNKGKIASEKLTLKGGVALTDDVSGRQLGDLINDMGIELIAGLELTALDNQ